MDLYKRIQDLKKEKKVKTATIAHALDMEQSNYVRVEKKGAKLTYEQIEAISNALGVSVKEFLFGENEVIQTINTKELEDLRKEVENLKKELHYENLLKSNNVGKIEMLCWNFIREFMINEVQNLADYCYFKQIRIILDEIIASEEKTIKRAVRDIKEKYIEEDFDLTHPKTDIYGSYYSYFFPAIKITTYTDFGKRIFREYEKMMKKGNEGNSTIIGNLIRFVIGEEKNSNFEDNFLGFCLKNKLILDVDLLNIYDIYKEIEESNQQLEAIFGKDEPKIPFWKEKN